MVRRGTIRYVPFELCGARRVTRAAACPAGCRQHGGLRVQMRPPANVRRLYVCTEDGDMFR